MPRKARLELVPFPLGWSPEGGLLDLVQEVAAALSHGHLPGVLILHRLYYGPVSVGLDDIVEQVEVWGEPEQAVAVAAGDFGEDAVVMKLVDHPVGGRDGYVQGFRGGFDVDDRLLV